MKLSRTIVTVVLMGTSLYAHGSSATTDKSFAFMQDNRKASIPHPGDRTNCATTIHVNKHAILQVSVEILLQPQWVDDSSHPEHRPHHHPTQHGRFHQERDSYPDRHHIKNSYDNNRGDDILPGLVDVYDAIAHSRKWLIHVEEVPLSTGTTVAAPSSLIDLKRELSLSWYPQPEQQPSSQSRHTDNCHYSSTHGGGCRWGRATVSFLIVLHDDEELAEPMATSASSRIRNTNERDHEPVAVLPDDATIGPARRSVPQRTLILSLWEHRLKEKDSQDQEHHQQRILTRRLATLPRQYGYHRHSQSRPTELDLVRFLERKEPLPKDREHNHHQHPTQLDPLIKVHLQANSTVILQSFRRPNGGDDQDLRRPKDMDGQDLSFRSPMMAPPTEIGNQTGIPPTMLQQDVLDLAPHFNDQGSSWKMVQWALSIIIFFCVIRWRVLKNRYLVCLDCSDDASPTRLDSVEDDESGDEKDLQAPPSIQRQIVVDPDRPSFFPTASIPDSDGSDHDLNAEEETSGVDHPSDSHDDSSRLSTGDDDNDSEASLSHVESSQHENDNSTENDTDSNHLMKHDSSAEGGHCKRLMSVKELDFSSSQPVYRQQPRDGNEMSDDARCDEYSTTSSGASSHESRSSLATTHQAPSGQDTPMFPVGPRHLPTKLCTPAKLNRNGDDESCCSRKMESSDLKFKKPPAAANDDEASSDEKAKDELEREISSECNFSVQQSPTTLIPDTTTSARCDSTAVHHSYCNAVVDLAELSDTPGEQDASSTTSSSLRCTRAEHERSSQTSQLKAHLCTISSSVPVVQRPPFDVAVDHSATTQSPSPKRTKNPTTESVQSQSCAWDDSTSESSSQNPASPKSMNSSRRPPQALVASDEIPSPNTIVAHSRTSRSLCGQDSSRGNISVMKVPFGGSMIHFAGGSLVETTDDTCPLSPGTATTKTVIDHEAAFEESPFSIADRSESPLQQPVSNEKFRTVRSAELAFDDTTETRRDAESPLSPDPALGRSYCEIPMGQSSMPDESPTQDLCLARKSDWNSASEEEDSVEAATHARTVNIRGACFRRDPELRLPHFDDWSQSTSHLLTSAPAPAEINASIGSSLHLDSAKDSCFPPNAEIVSENPIERASVDENHLYLDGRSQASKGPPTSKTDCIDSFDRIAHKGEPSAAQQESSDAPAGNGWASGINVSNEFLVNSSSRSPDRINDVAAFEGRSRTQYDVAKSFHAAMGEQGNELQQTSPGREVEGWLFAPRRAVEVLTQYSEEFSQNPLPASGGSNDEGFRDNNSGDSHHRNEPCEVGMNGSTPIRNVEAGNTGAHADHGESTFDGSLLAEAVCPNFGCDAGSLEKLTAKTRRDEGDSKPCGKADGHVTLQASPSSSGDLVDALLGCINKRERSPTGSSPQLAKTQRREHDAKPLFNAEETAMLHGSISMAGEIADVTVASSRRKDLPNTDDDDGFRVNNSDASHQDDESAGVGINQPTPRRQIQVGKTGPAVGNDESSFDPAFAGISSDPACSPDRLTAQTRRQQSKASHSSGLVDTTSVSASAFANNEALASTLSIHHVHNDSRFFVKTSGSISDSYVSTLPPHSDCSAMDFPVCRDFTPTRNSRRKGRQSPIVLQLPSTLRIDRTDKSRKQRLLMPRTGSNALKEQPQNNGTISALKQKRKRGIDSQTSPTSTSLEATSPTGMGVSPWASPAFAASNENNADETSGQKSSIRKKRRIILAMSPTEPVQHESPIQNELSSSRKRSSIAVAVFGDDTGDSDLVQFLGWKRGKSSPLPFSQSSIVPDWVPSNRLQQASEQFESDGHWKLASIHPSPSPNTQAKEARRSPMVSARKAPRAAVSVQTPKRRMSQRRGEKSKG
jgi:hypothetical protein